jgi:hypothetical protein
MILTLRESHVRTRAYHLWENDPSPDGNAEKHWEDARRQIEAEGDGAPRGPEPGVDQSADREQGGQIAPEEQLQDVSGDDANALRRAKRSR